MSVTRTRYLVSQVRAVPQLSSVISITKVKYSRPVNQNALEKLQIVDMNAEVIVMNKKLDEMKEKTTIEGEILQPLPAKRLEHNMTLKNSILDSVLEQRQRKTK